MQRYKCLPVVHPISPLFTFVLSILEYTQESWWLGTAFWEATTTLALHLEVLLKPVELWAFRFFSSGPLLTVSESVILAASGKQKACLSAVGWSRILSHSSSLLLPLSHLRLQLALFYAFEILEGETVMDSNADAWTFEEHSFHVMVVSAASLALSG